jgi:hypothetical protein
LLECKQVTALNAGANKRPHPRDLSPRAGRLHCLVGDFADEDLFNLVDGLLIHGIDPLPSFPPEKQETKIGAPVCLVAPIWLTRPMEQSPTIVSSYAPILA